MKFAQLKQACDAFGVLVNDGVGRAVVGAVSVVEPREPPNELHFVRLVAWCYAFFFEVASPVVRHITGVLRQSDAEAHKRVSAVTDRINNLRTYNFHNLTESSGDVRKKRQAEIWMLSFGAGEIDWAQCSAALCEDATIASSVLTAKWQEMVAADADGAVQGLIQALERTWLGHEFDPFIEAAARSLAIEGLDCVKYRDGKLEKWRALVSLFETRDQAEFAIGAAIRSELLLTFGDMSKPTP